MRRSPRNDSWWLRAIPLLLLVATFARSYGAQVILHLKNGDRLTGTILSESTNVVTLATPFFGNVPVPLGEITKREPFPESGKETNGPPAVRPAGTNNTTTTSAPDLKPAPTSHPPLSPANPEAASIASTPNYWKHDVRFGLNTRYAAKDSQEITLLAKSTYGKPPFRHIFDGSLRYGKIDDVISANSIIGSEKTEYQLSPKTYCSAWWVGVSM